MPGGAAHVFRRVNNVLPDLRQLISPPRSPFFACGVVTIAADSECKSDVTTVHHDFAGTEALADTVAFLHGWLVGFTAGRCGAWKQPVVSAYADATGMPPARLL